MGGEGTHDIAEVGLIPYLLAFCNEGFRDYQLLPVFPLKLFRHKSIFVRTDGGIRAPSDLRGRRVATVGYSSSGLTWIRGILEDEYALKPEEIHWCSGVQRFGRRAIWSYFKRGKKSCLRTSP